MKMKKEQKKQNRVPIVVVVGHIDHGKTSILDCIRKTHIAKNEEGGITQHISVCQVECSALFVEKGTKKTKQQKITFIDTPGHELFTAMRLRGTQIADIAMLVVAVDDGVNTQTIEAIQYIKKNNIPFMVVINKIDLKDIDIEKIKQQLAQNNVLLEEWGGDVPMILVSAKTGKGINEITEMIFLMAEMQDIRINNSVLAKGVVIESYIDHLKGITAVLLIKDGKMEIKDTIVINGSQIEKIKIMEDWLGNPVKQGLSSMPITIRGLKKISQLGAEFQIFKNQKKAIDYVLSLSDKNKMEEDKGQEDQIEIKNSQKELEEKIKVLNIVLKVDKLGSLEIIEKFFEHFFQEKVILRILKKDVGKINESDAILASNFNAIIIAFCVKSDSIAEQIINQKNIKVFYFTVIYHLIEQFPKIVKQSLEPKIIKNVLGRLKITTIFHQDKNKQIIGGKVIEGNVIISHQVNVLRKVEDNDILKEKIICVGKIEEIQQKNKVVKKVPKDQECAVLFKEAKERIKIDDILEIYKEEFEKIKI